MAIFSSLKQKHVLILYRCKISKSPFQSVLIPSQNYRESYNSALDEGAGQMDCRRHSSQIQDAVLSSGKGKTMLNNKCWCCSPVQVMDWILLSEFALLACLKLQPTNAINSSDDEAPKALSISSCAPQCGFDRSSTPINSSMKCTRAEVSELWALTWHYSCWHKYSDRAVMNTFTRRSLCIVSGSCILKDRSGVDSHLWFWLWKDRKISLQIKEGMVREQRITPLSMQ